MARYDTNETMKLLGKQTYAGNVSDENIKQLKEILEGYKDDPDTICLLADCFLLGRIEERKAQRTKKKARATA